MPWDPLPTGDADGAPVPVGASLDRVLRGLGGPSTNAVQGVFGRWAEIVGEHVAAHTRPLSLRDGTLRVAVDDPAWAPQLRFLESEILGRVRAAIAGVEVERLEVRVRPARDDRRS